MHISIFSPRLNTANTLAHLHLKRRRRIPPTGKPLIHRMALDAFADTELAAMAIVNGEGQ